MVLFTGTAKQSLDVVSRTESIVYQPHFDLQYGTHLFTSTIITVLWNRTGTLMIYCGTAAQLFEKRCTKSYLFTVRNSIVSRKLASHFLFVLNI